MIQSFTNIITANGSSNKFIVDDRKAGAGHLEPVGFALSGSFNSATVTLYIALANDSPLTFVADSTYTSAGVHTMEVIPGTRFKFTVSGSGSPQSSIRIGVTGEIKQEA